MIDAIRERLNFDDPVSGENGRNLAVGTPLESLLNGPNRFEEIIRDILSQTLCILWSADVYEIEEGGSRVVSPDRFLWSTRVHNEATAQIVLPLNIESGSTYHQAWLKNRNPEDNQRSAEIAVSALIDNLPVYSVEFRCRDANGRERWLHEHVTLDRISTCHWRAVGICTDVTARKVAEERIRQSDLRHRAVIEQAVEAIYFVDVETSRVIDSNPAFQRLLGYSAEELALLTIDEIDTHHCDTSYQYLLRCPNQLINGVRKYQKKNGSLVVVEMSTSCFLLEGRQIICTVARDMTERRRMKARINAYQQQLRTMASELLLTEERERRRLAIDLHDGIGQNLAVVKMKIEQAVNGLAAKESEHRLEDQILDDALSLVRRSIAMTRNLTFELSPPILYEGGLSNALESLCDRIKRDYAIDVTFEDDGLSKPTSDEARNLLFHAVRELLHNVVKHSKAKHVVIKLKRDQNRVRIDIVDDGVGCDATSASRNGFGLFSIRERLSPYGGTLIMESTQGGGTCVTLTANLVQ